MAKSKVEQFKQLSPLAAAIVFSASMPTFVQADDFVVSSQEDLDDAVESINFEGQFSHSITFTSKVSGTQLSMDSLYVYDGGELTIDGADAKDLTLKIMDKNNDYGVYAYDADISISNVSIVEGGNAGDGYIAYLWENSSLTLDNVNITSASIGNDSDEGAIWLDNSNATISNSSFSNLSGSYVIGFDSDSYYDSNTPENDELRTLSISNTTFENNFNQNNVVMVYADGYGSENVEVTFTDLSFNNNEVTEGDTVYVGSANYGYGGDVTLDFVMANTSLTNNTAGSILELDSGTGEGYYSSTLNANVVNVTMANNTAYSGGVLNIEHSYGDEPAYLNVNIAHVTIANNFLDESGQFGIYIDSAEEEGDLISVNILNSIVTNNTYTDEEAETPVTEEFNLYAEREITVMNSLIGIEEGEGGFIAGENSDNKNLFSSDAMLGELTLDKKTGTMYLRPDNDSPAIDKGTDEFNDDIAEILGVEAADLIDQLGNKRTAGTAPDMGAVEKTKKKGSSSSSFGSFGFGSVLAGLGLLGFRRKR